MSMDINSSLKKELEKIANLDIHHPRYPEYRKKVMDAADIINYVVVEIFKKESNSSN